MRGAAEGVLLLSVCVSHRVCSCCFAVFVCSLFCCSSRSALGFCVCSIAFSALTGKTVVSELSMLRLFSNYPGSKVVYIAPLKALARERIEDWTSSRSFQGVLGKKIVELTGDTAPDQRAIMASDIIITTVRAHSTNKSQ